MARKRGNFLRTTATGFLCVLFFAIPSVGADTVWQRLTQDSFVVWFRNGDLKNARYVLTTAQEALLRIAQYLEIDTAHSIVIIIASTEEEFVRFTDGQIPEWGLGAADAQRSTVFLKSPRFAQAEAIQPRIVAHELGHVLLAEATGGFQLERWLDEGFAQFVSGEQSLSGAVGVSRALMTGNLISLDEIDEVLTFHRDRAVLAYFEAKTAVAYLVDTHGREAFLRIVNGLRDGRDLNIAMREAIGMDILAFQQAWHSDLKRKYGWYIILDFRLLLSAVFVVLFITAIIATRRRIQRKKQLWEDEAWYEVEET